jgi:hypothetical protein
MITLLLQRSLMFTSFRIISHYYRRSFPLRIYVPAAVTWIALFIVGDGIGGINRQKGGT